MPRIDWNQKISLGQSAKVVTICAAIITIANIFVGWFSFPFAIGSKVEASNARIDGIEARLDRMETKIDRIIERGILR